MKIIRCFAVILAVVAVAVPLARAEKLYLHLTDGTQMEFDFATRPQITFNSRNALRIKCDGMGLKTKPFNNVTKITFGELSGISDAAVVDKMIKPEDGNRVALIGFKAGTKVNVAAANGAISRVATVDNEVRFELPLSDLPKGVYIVAADREICKLLID